jgi:hypothetical protein
LRLVRSESPRFSVSVLLPSGATTTATAAATADDDDVLGGTFSLLALRSLTADVRCRRRSPAHKERKERKKIQKIQKFSKKFSKFSKNSLKIFCFFLVCVVSYAWILSRVRCQCCRQCWRTRLSRDSFAPVASQRAQHEESPLYITKTNPFATKQ